MAKIVMHISMHCTVYSEVGSDFTLGGGGGASRVCNGHCNQGLYSYVLQMAEMLRLQ